MTSKLEAIKAVLKATADKKKVVDDYKAKLEQAEQDLQTAKNDREQHFTFENDERVVSLEGYRNRLQARYTSLKQTFDNEVSDKMREVDDLFFYYCEEKWLESEEARTVKTELVESFKKTAVLLDKYSHLPEKIKKQALADIKDENYFKAFSGQVALIGIYAYDFGKFAEMDVDTYQKIYATARKLGAEFEE